MQPSRAIREQITAEAIEWLLRMQEQPRAPAQDEAFSEWLMRSPLHIEEYLEVTTAWTGMVEPDHADSSTAALIEAARNSVENNIVRPQRFARTIDDAPDNSQSAEGGRSRVKWVAIAAALLSGVASWLALHLAHQN